MKARSLLSILAGLLAWSLCGCSTTVTAEDWQRDLRQLEQALAARHVDLYHSVPEEAFKAAADELHARIPALTPPETLVGIAQLVAMVGDGHTSFFPGDQGRFRFGYYPLALYVFEDGIHLTATTAEYRHLLGKRLVQIDDTPLDEAWRRVSTVVAADNDMEFTYTVPFEIIRPELLHVLGIAHAADRATFRFADGTAQEFLPLSRDAWRDAQKYIANPLFGPEGKAPTSRHEILFATSLTLPHLQERKYYWYTFLADQRTLFMQYNVCWDQKDRPPFAEVVAEMFAFADRNAVERLVIDLRQNAGGEPRIAEPLVEELERRPELGARGSVLVLVGRRTYSAALTNAAQLRARAGARIVGEPPRGKPNSPSEGRDIDLDRTKAWATVSTQFVARDPALGDVAYLPVDIGATYTFEAYRAGRDPVLEAALAAPLRAQDP